MNLTQSSEEVQAAALAYAFTWDQNEGWEISKLPNMFSYCTWKVIFCFFFSFSIYEMSPIACISGMLSQN